MADEDQPVEEVPVESTDEPEVCPIYADCGKVLADVEFCQRCGYFKSNR